MEKYSFRVVRDTDINNKSFRQLKVCTKISASRQFEGGKFSYAKFNVLKMEYDETEPFGKSIQ